MQDKAQKHKNTQNPPKTKTKQVKENTTKTLLHRAQNIPKLWAIKHQVPRSKVMSLVVLIN